MIRMVASSSAKQAKSYYTEALIKSDYYLNDQELPGQFRGLLADRIGVTGPVRREYFFDICENRNPLTGLQLTARTSANRRVGYDINFHVPKSVSVIHALSKDDHILNAFRGAVHDTMADIEKDMATRVRKDKNDSDRKTGELLYADFVHQTARPVEGHLPDPHLHAHCYVFNATWDEKEQRVKAAQFGNIVRDSPYYTARFQKRMAARLMDLGYQIRTTKKAFEIEGVPQYVIDHFSKRTDEIGRMAKAKGITDADALDALGARTRSKKNKSVSMDELKSDWRGQIRTLGMTEAEGSRPVRFGPDTAKEKPTLENSVDFSLNHHFEKASVVPERKLLATAYKQSIGNQAISLESVDERLHSNASLLAGEENAQKVFTTRDILKEEQYMVRLAQAGRGTMLPLYSKLPEIQAGGQQGVAIAHILSTSDRVSIIRGAAGSGKTTLMREAVDWIEKAGKSVTVVAPTSVASRDVLSSEGFAQATTVAALLEDKDAIAKLKNGVLWVDEAGMLGTKNMTAVLELAAKQNARLILGGDTRQHSSVDRGDALRILNTVGKIKAAEVTKIYRQKGADYNQAVEYLSNGNVKEGFGKLNTMGAIREIDPKKPHDLLVDDYLSYLRDGKKALVISPTNAHRQELTEAIRVRMREQKMLGKKEIVAEKLEPQYFSQAEKDDWKNYKPGQVIQFVQNTTGIKRGSRWLVSEVSQKDIILKDPVSGKQTPLPQGRSACFDVLERSHLSLSKGDKVRVTRNSYDENKSRMDNGQMLDVMGVKKDGRIVLQNGISKQQYFIDRRFGHIDHAHCITSYASQGKTVDNVLIAQPAATFPATNAKQFYVSASRAREGINIYTDDKKALLGHAQRLGDRTSAMELTAMQKHQDHAMNRQRETLPPDKASRPQQKDTPSITKKSPKDIEPGI